jgi:hypothetical protein
MSGGDPPRTILPAEVAALLGGRDVQAGVGLTIQLLTVDEPGWPRVALLSVGEVLAIDERNLRLALWPTSQTTANLSRTGRGVLCLVDAGAFFTVLIHAARGVDLVDPAPRAVFEARIDELRRDEVPYAVLTSGIVFDLPDRDVVVARWHETIEALAAIVPTRAVGPV